MTFRFFAAGDRLTKTLITRDEVFSVKCFITYDATDKAAFTGLERISGASDKLEFTIAAE